MNTSTKNSTENPLERVSEKEQVSVYSVNFTQSINNHNADKEIVTNPLKTEILEEKNIQSWTSKTIFRRRNAIGIAAILAVGILHFAFQLSVIQTEKKQVVGSPVKVEQVSEQPAETKPAEFEIKKADIVLPEKTAPPVKPRQIEIAPSKPQIKKKDAVEPKAERLRRAEKILTGI